MNGRRRRTALILSALGLGLVSVLQMRDAGATAVKTQESMDITVVRQGRALARIVVPADKTGSAEAAAVLLADYIQKSTSVRLEIVKEPDAGGAMVALHCGATAYVKGLDLGTEKMDPDGFVIAMPDLRHVVLVGSSATGQMYAVYEFLERYVGVRWLFPGESGEHVPAGNSLTIPASEVREQPSFEQRLLSGLDLQERPESRGEQALWAGRNRMRERLEFHHNLWRLFPPEKYFATHPEFFPLLDGRRFKPQPAPGESGERDERAQVFWQPCFTAAGLADEALRNIEAFFEQNPRATSYSLGINDGGGHCECPACLAHDGGRTNPLGLRDASPAYYAWCNDVARRVSRRFPGKKFGLLAYAGVYSPAPGLRLDEHLVPFITYDRMKWVDPGIERKGHALSEEWASAAAVLGWYDYSYGGLFYTAPRVYFHKLAEYLRYGYEHGVRYYYAEAYPSADWNEGPKLYLLLKLLWNPYRDVDALLADWYRAAVGPIAAPDLAEYFSFWEEFWTKRVPGTVWFRNNGDGQFLDFSDDAYLEALKPEDLVRCETLLAKVVAAAAGKTERARAQHFYNGFMARKTELQKGLLSQATREKGNR